MQWLVDRFKNNKERTAFVHEGRGVTYGDLVAQIQADLDALDDYGVKAGKTVAILADYSPEVFSLILALGIQRCNIIPLTHESVVEDKTALGISGCDFFASFTDDGRNYELKRRALNTDNHLMREFRQTGSPGLVLFSSGSTGEPKGILHDFARVAEKFRQQREGIVSICFLALDHFGGINTILAITSSLGTVVTVGKRSVEAICEAIQDHKVQLLPTTPSFLTMMVSSNLHRAYDLGSLTKITYGTEVMPQTTLDRLHKAFPGVKMQQTYGLSELGVLRSKSKDDGSLWVRIGGEGFNTKIVDDILWIKSDYRMVGYLNAPSGFDEDGWFNTQDRVEVDGDYFRILGRITDIINVGGKKVYPAEIENVVIGLDNIVDAVVYGEEHALVGQIIIVKARLAQPEKVTALKRRIRKACQEKLSAYKVPSKVVITEEQLETVRFKKKRSADPPT